jgi:hypothetical protein
VWGEGVDMDSRLLDFIFSGISVHFEDVVEVAHARCFTKDERREGRVDRGFETSNEKKKRR